jgi:TetR/AcrR family transcriptional regulator, transcriptional repressor of aconitase
VPKVSEEHRAARRAQILDGARRAFSTHGYDGATVARLEEETGLSRGAIFNYFSGKTDLFVALARDVNERYVDLLIDKGVEGAFRAMAEESPEWLSVQLEIHGRLRHDPEFVRRMEEGLDDRRERVREWLEARQADGTLRGDVDVVHLGRFMTMLLNGLALRIAGGDPTDVEPIVSLLNDALAPRD